MKKFQFDLRIWIGLTGVIVACIALLTIVGYLFHNENLYTWDGGIGMALNTAIEFVFVGLCFVWISLSKRLWHDS